MEPPKIIAIEDARPDVMTSWNSHIPSIEAATPRTADETMCVIGDVTLMDNKLAILIRKPRTPVINDPHIKVCKGVSSPSAGMTVAGVNSNSVTDGSSPIITIIGANTTMLSRFVYHERCNALPLTTSKLFLMTTECKAVIAELATPKETPIREMGVLSRNTPTKNPMVTIEQETKIRREGRE